MEEKAATAEMIYDLISLLQVKIDKDIATALYTGISTDTDHFFMRTQLLQPIKLPLT